MRVHFFHERPRVAAELIDGRGLGEQIKGDVRRAIAAAVAGGGSSRSRRYKPARRLRAAEDPLEDQARRQVV
jgi:hypothetical protein